MSGFNGISGLGGGVDWTSYIDSIIQGEQRALANTIGRREVKVSAEKTVFANVKGLLDGLRTSIRSFQFSGDFKVKSVVSSDATKVTGTASLAAFKQNMRIEIDDLAQAEVQRFTHTGVDDSVASADTTISIEVRGTTHNIEIKAGDTFKDLRDKINAARIGVTAAVFDSGDGTGEPARLTITDNKVGDEDSVNTTANVNVNFTGLLGTLATQDDDTNPQTATRFIVKAQNASIKINGDTIVRSSNTISDVIPGVTLNLLEETDVGEPVTINVTESTKDAATKVKQMVDRYNEAVKALKVAVAYDPAAQQQGPTAGNSTLRNVLSRLQSEFMASVSQIPNSSSSIRSLSDLGVKSSFNAQDPASNGLLTFDESKFNGLLNTNFDDVVQFFEGLEADGQTYDGFAVGMGRVMDSFTTGATGSINAKLTSIDSELGRIGKEKIDRLERLSRKEERLRGQFARLEGQLARLNGQQSTLNQSIQSLQLNNQYIANRR
jgi:flagellar hook-associated protein 2